MTDKKSNDSRRKLLKSIAASSGAVVAGKSLPESWTKPIVDSVLLPAHAATSGDLVFFADITNNAPVGSISSAFLCVTVTGNNYIGQVAITYTEGPIGGITAIYTNPSTPLGTQSIMTGTCDIPGGAFIASNLTTNSVDYSFPGSGAGGTLPLAACNLPPVVCPPVNTAAAAPEGGAGAFGG